jgi:hypothetical protein
MERTNLTLISTAIELRERGNKPLSRGLWMAVDELSPDEARAALFRILGDANDETVWYLGNCMVEGVKKSIRERVFLEDVLAEIERSAD